ncbi:hypothetical protein T01_5844 [Trichinella spiralis]|uniref:Uncharacterized protein n=1 Tax=Trichinella spiralis TaxID=6334 RepID=A0A0V0ZWX6_TRISP|nr:hypothetical protein T01_5844 [Trichinella spiralis]
MEKYTLTLHINCGDLHKVDSEILGQQHLIIWTKPSQDHESGQTIWAQPY